MQNSHWWQGRQGDPIGAGHTQGDSIILELFSFINGRGDPGVYIFLFVNYMQMYSFLYVLEIYKMKAQERYECKATKEGGNHHSVNGLKWNFLLAQCYPLSFQSPESNL